MTPTHLKYLFVRIIPALLLCVAISARADEKSATTKPAPFEKDIEAFEKADLAKPPPKDANLFIGSSSIVKWKTLAEDFPGVPVINRGFGGSQIPDSIRFASRIVLPYHPKRIFLYAGDNDLAAGHKPEQVFADFKTFVQTVRTGQPDVPIYFISIKPSPSRAKLMDKVKESNRLIEEWMKQGKDLTYIDVFTPMLGPDGQPRPELFVADKLHMSRPGYEIWTATIRPLIEK